MTESAGAGAGAPTAGAGAAGAGAGTGAPAAGSGAASGPWYGDKIDNVTVGFWQNKGIDVNDPIAVASKLTEFYRNSERFVGAPPEEMIRIPKANAAESDIKAYWQRIGVPAEAKDYDLSAVKFTDGSELDSGFADMFRAAAHQARVPKEQAAGLMNALIKHMEANDAAELAAKTAHINEQKALLDKNWGTNKTYNMAVAQRTLQTLGEATGLTPEQTQQAWDALSTVGGIGSSFAMEMLRTIGARMGEAPFISAQPGQGGNNQIMSASQAQAEIAALKQDKGFYDKLMKKDAEAHRRWNDLHKIAYPTRAA